MHLLSIAPAAAFSFLCSTALAQGVFVDLTAVSGLSVVGPVEQSAFGAGARGVAAGDFDLDGDLDLIVPGLGTTPIRYFANDGTAVFTERTAHANLPLSQDTIGMTVADWDNDGDPDLFIGRATGSELYDNDGTGRFTVLTGPGFNLSAGVITYGCSFGDFDNDGWLDLVTVVWDPLVPNHFYRNNGDGTGFTRMPASAGLDEISATLAIIWLDYNEDGWLDVYTVNDKGMYVQPNAMYRNNGDGTFTDVSIQTNSSAAMWAMGADFVDVFNDGGQDIYITDGPPDHKFLIWDETIGQYWHAEYALGMWGGTDGWACEWFDYNNDGWQDLYVTHEDVWNSLFRNPGLPISRTNPIPWADIAYVVNAHSELRNQACVIIADFDNDGRDDSLQVFRDYPTPGPSLQLLMNYCLAENWIRFDPEGVISNRDGIGAKIRLWANDLKQFQTVRNAVGFASATDQRVHFGVGPVNTVDRVEVIWPSGQFQILKNLPVNQDMVLREPVLEHVGNSAAGVTTTIQFDSQGDAGLLYGIALSLTPGQFPLPGGRLLPIIPDALTWASLAQGNWLAPNSVGVVSASGTGSTPLQIPNDPVAAGLVFQCTAVTFDATEPGQIRNILSPITITVQ